MAYHVQRSIFCCKILLFFFLNQILTCSFRSVWFVRVTYLMTLQWLHVVASNPFRRSLTDIICMSAIGRKCLPKFSRSVQKWDHKRTVCHTVNENHLQKTSTNITMLGANKGKKTLGEIKMAQDREDWLRWIESFLCWKDLMKVLIKMAATSGGRIY